MLQTVVSFIVIVLLVLLTSILSTINVAALFYFLEKVTKLREEHSELYLLLPVSSLLIYILIKYFRSDLQSKISFLKTAFVSKSMTLSLKNHLYIFAGTIITHLFGGSAGREGAAIQTSTILTDSMRYFLKNKGHHFRPLLLACAVCTSFGVATGSAAAGVMFAYSFFERRFSLFKTLPFLGLAAGVGSTLSSYLINHLTLPELTQTPPLTLHFLWTCLLLGLIFAIFIRCFLLITHLIKSILGLLSDKELPRLVAGSTLMVFLIFIFNHQRFLGLGLESLQSSFLQTKDFQESIFKGLYTALTLGSGFMGGEFIPLLYMGSALGSALSVFLHYPTEILAGVGFISLFGIAARMPIVATIMAYELLNHRYALPVFVCTFIGTMVMRKKGIYDEQQ